MKIAVVGCGGIGRAHARAYRQIAPDAEMVFLDIDPTRGEPLAAEFGGRAGRFPEDLPADVCGASVTTPPGAHAAPVRHLLEHGIPVFCEKPLTLQTGAGLELAALARRMTVPLLVGFKMRYEPVFRQARDLVPVLGELYAVSATKAQPHHERPGHDWVKEVGAMFELSSHDLDLVQWLTGLRASAVSARLHRHEGWLGDTRFSLHVRYGPGIDGHFCGGYCVGTHFCYRDLTITLVGRNGYMRIERPDRIVLHTDRLDVRDLGKVDTNTFPLELANFLDVIEGGGTAFIQADEANHITALIEAAIRSDRGNGELQTVEA